MVPSQSPFSSSCQLQWSVITQCLMCLQEICFTLLLVSSCWLGITSASQRPAQTLNLGSSVLKGTLPNTRPSTRFVCLPISSNSNRTGISALLCYLGLLSISLWAFKKKATDPILPSFSFLPPSPPQVTPEALLESSRAWTFSWCSSSGETLWGSPNYYLMRQIGVRAASHSMCRVESFACGGREDSTLGWERVKAEWVWRIIQPLSVGGKHHTQKHTRVL